MKDLANKNSMIQNNGLSNKKISLANKNNQWQVLKEKNSNWQNVKKVFLILNHQFLKMPSFLDETDSSYSYEYVNGYTYSKVKMMSLKQTYQILDFILEYQSLYQNEIGQVIVHGDISPVNVIFAEQTKLPLKIIDWDGAYFGSKYDDIAYVCWLWVNIGNPRTKNKTKINYLKEIFHYLHYDTSDLKAVRESLLRRINKDAHNIRQKDREVFLKEWYEYCQQWTERYLNEDLLTTNLV